MDIYEKGQIWLDDGDGLVYSHTKFILRTGDAFFHAQTLQRLGPINVDELDAVPIPIHEVWPPYSADLTRAPIPLPTDCYVKYANLLDCGTGIDPPPSDLVLAEAQICEILKNNPHRNIAEYIGCITKGDRITALCFARYNMTLANRLKDDDHPVGQDVCVGIEHGIQHLHNLGYSHNDINPHNIMFNSEGTPIIIDFDSCAKVGKKLAKRGGWEDQIYEYASPANDFSALERIKNIIDNQRKHKCQE
jgi:serine/threonine protein kinase